MAGAPKKVQTRKIGRYEIQGQIGRGGMATVFRATDTRFQRVVAIKLLPRELLHDARFRARFEREATTVASLEHPAIVPVYDYGEQDGQLYLVMRFMDGGALSERLRASGPLGLHEIGSIMGRLAPALDEAHERGIIHRDLKPANILFDRRGLPYLADFGIVKLAQSANTLTGTGLMGTPAYMSPEQVRGKETLDGRSDIYSLGVIVFQMLTGRLPYRADTPLGIAIQHVTEPVPDLSTCRAGLAPGCQALIDCAMAKEREDRYQTAGALAAAIEALAGEAAPDEPARSGDYTWLELDQQTSPPADLAARLYNEAIEAMDAGVWTQAIERLNDLLALDPGYRDTYARLAEANRQKRMGELLDEARAAMSEEDWDAALSSLAQILSSHPRHGEARSLRAEARRRKQLQRDYLRAQEALEDDRYADAIAALQQVVSIEAEYQDAAELLQQARHEEEQVQAKARWRRAEAHFSRAQEAAEANEWSKVVTEAEEAVALQPEKQTYADFLADARREETHDRQYGVALQALGNEAWKEAIALLEALLRQAPNYRDAAAQLEEARAQQAALEAVRAREVRLQDLQIRAEAREAASDWDEATALWAEAIELAPERDDLLVNHDAAKAEAERRAQAANLYKQVQAALAAAEWEVALQKADALTALYPKHSEYQALLVEAKERQAQAAVEAAIEEAGKASTVIEPAPTTAQEVAQPAPPVEEEPASPLDGPVPGTAVSGAPPRWRQPAVAIPLLLVLLLGGLGLAYGALVPTAAPPTATASPTPGTTGVTRAVTPVLAGDKPPATSTTTATVTATATASPTPRPSRTSTRTPRASATPSATSVRRTPTATYLPPTRTLVAPTATTAPPTQPPPTQPPPTQPPPTQPPPTQPPPTQPPPTQPPPTQPPPTQPPPTEPPPSTRPPTPEP